MFVRGFLTTFMYERLFMKNITKFVFALCLLVPAMYAMQHGPNFELLGIDVELPQSHNDVDISNLPTFYMLIANFLQPEYVSMRADYLAGFPNLIQRLPMLSRASARATVAVLQDLQANGFTPARLQEARIVIANHMIDLARFFVLQGSAPEGLEAQLMFGQKKRGYKNQFSRIVAPLIAEQINILRNGMTPVFGAFEAPHPAVPRQPRHRALRPLQF